jgi:hypothetical protein
VPWLLLGLAVSSVESSVKNMMMTTVRGRFKQVSATPSADEEHPEGCCVEVTLEVASLDTGVADRDAHLRSADFFDAERYPQITFKSKRLEGKFATSRSGTPVSRLAVRKPTATQQPSRCSSSEMRDAKQAAPVGLKVLPLSCEELRYRPVQLPVPNTSSILPSNTRNAIGAPPQPWSCSMRLIASPSFTVVMTVGASGT